MELAREMALSNVSSPIGILSGERHGSDEGKSALLTPKGGHTGRAKNKEVSKTAVVGLRPVEPEGITGRHSARGAVIFIKYPRRLR